MVDVSIRNVRKSFGSTEVIHGLDMEISKGEFVVVVGPSGCGKSTLLRMIAGLETISSGEIAIGGQVVNEVEPKARGVAMVFQNYALYPHMTAFQNIGYSLRVARRPKREIRERVQRVAEVLGLDDLLDRRPSQLSGGQRQRVAMGRAIIREPGVFLFDEPLSNLDAKLRSQMRVEIRRLHESLGATSLFVTHDQVEAMTMADRLVVMNDGVAEQIGSPKEVYATPSTTYVAGFIGSPAMNFFSGTVQGSGDAVVLTGGAVVPVIGSQGSALAREPVTVGIRPEHMRIATPDDPGQFAANLDFIEDLGASQLLHASFDGTEFIVQLQSEQSVELNDDLSFRVEPHHVHLFDPSTGRRLGGSA
ncbi:MAG: ABC transporter ATP-binding protein [Methyloligellaceae bacterium]